MRGIAGAGVAAAIVILCALPAAAGAAPTVVPSSVSGSVKLPAGGARSLKLTCPATAVALHGAVTRLPSGVRIADSRPGDADARRWTFRFASAARAAREVSATVRCVRLDLPAGVTGVVVRVGNLSRPRLRVKAGSSRRLTLRCQPGYTPVGYGMGVSTRAVELAAAVPGERGWSFRLANGGNSPARVMARIRCLQRVAAGSKHGAGVRLAFKVTQSFSSRRGPSFSTDCTRRRFSVATGFWVGDDSGLSLNTTYPRRRSNGRWLFEGGAQRVRGYLICLSPDSRFD
jgi:hypothetical protein